MVRQLGQFGSGLTLGLGAAMLVLSGCNYAPAPQAAPTASPVPISTPTPTPTPTQRSTEELAAAVVRISPADDDGNMCWHGSGTVVDAFGTILTNFHVVENEPGQCDYQKLIVSVTQASDQPPTATYLGEVYAFDADADLAVVRVTSGLDGEWVSPDLAHIEPGDSDAVGLGDSLRILGYPGIGGETISFTEGKVAGFLSDSQHGSRAWIKTAATIAGGNSGGAALDEDDRLVGVPTQARAGDGAQITDCRVIEDTNGDGYITSEDSCIPIGGFMNGLRPISLAESLLREAASSEPIAIADLVPEDRISAESAEIGNIVFSTEVDSAGNPVNEAVSLPSDADSLCGTFEYEGMADGARYDLIWTVDGEISEPFSVQGARWVGGESGSWYVCATSDEGLTEGLWELVIYLSDETAVQSSWIYVGDDHPPVRLEIINGFTEPICSLFVSPSESSRWDPNRLRDPELSPGSSITMFVGAADYDLRADDCFGDTLWISGSLEVAGPTTVTVGDSL